MLLSLLIATERDLANPEIDPYIAHRIYQGLPDTVKKYQAVRDAILNILNRENISPNTARAIYEALPYLDKRSDGARGAMFKILNRENIDPREARDVYAVLLHNDKCEGPAKDAMINILNRQNITTIEAYTIYGVLPNEIKGSPGVLIPMFNKTRDSQSIWRLGNLLNNLPIKDQIYVVNHFSQETLDYLTSPGRVAPPTRDLINRILQTRKVEQFGVMEEAASEHRELPYSLPNTLKTGVASHLFGLEEERARTFVKAQKE